MLMKLERDRTKAKIEAIEAQMKAMQVSGTISSRRQNHLQITTR